MKMLLQFRSAFVALFLAGFWWGLSAAVGFSPRMFNPVVDMLG